MRERICGGGRGRERGADSVGEDINHLHTNAILSSSQYSHKAKLSFGKGPPCVLTRLEFHVE